MSRRHQLKAKQRGVTLVEILVTVVIISVGLLGVAALHTVTLRNGQDAHLRTQATALANDIIERMRANRNVALDSEAYDIAIADDKPTGAVTQAQKDLEAWLTLVESILPNGDGSVDGGSLVVGSKLFTITITWKERNSADEFSSFQTQVQL